MLEMPSHAVTFSGTYSNGNNDNYPYVIAVDVPKEIVDKVNVTGWFKAQLRDTNTQVYKQFVKEHPDFAVLCSYAIQDLSGVTNGN